LHGAIHSFRIFVKEHQIAFEAVATGILSTFEENLRPFKRELVIWRKKVNAWLGKQQMFLKLGSIGTIIYFLLYP